MGKHLIQKGVQRGGVAQHPRALVLAHHGARGTARVEIHLRITELRERLRRAEDGLARVEQELDGSY